MCHMSAMNHEPQAFVSDGFMPHRDRAQAVAVTGGCVSRFAVMAKRCPQSK